MASYTVSATYESEDKSVSVSPSSLDFLNPGDTVTFTGTSSGTWSGFDSAMWTSTSSATGTVVKTVKSMSSGYDVSDAVTFTYIGTGSMTCRARAYDKTPDSFTLSNLTNQDPKALITRTFTISGINDDITVYVSLSSSSLKFKLSSSSVAKSKYNDFVTGDTSVSASNGATITLVMEMPYDYSKSVTVYIDAYTYSTSFVASTRKYPTVDQKISIGLTSAPISMMSDVVEFFGRSQTPPALTDYLRGNNLVPSIEDNEHVPTAVPISLTDLLDTYSALYFRYRPASKSVSADTLSAAQTRALTWNMLTDYNVGYGELAEDVEYKYTYTSNGDTQASLSVTVASGSAGTWSSDNSYITLTSAAPQNREVERYGELTIWVRNAQDTSIVISQTVDYMFNFYGP